MAVSGIRTQEAVTINERNQLGMKNGKNTEKVTPSMEFSDINFFVRLFFRWLFGGRPSVWCAQFLLSLFSTQSTAEINTLVIRLAVYISTQ